MSNTNQRRLRRGISLAEVMVAMLVTSFGLMVFGTAFPGSSRLIHRSRHGDLAARACQSQLEVYREAGYASLPAIPAGASQTSVSFAAPPGLTGAVGTVTFTRVDAGFAPTNVPSGRVRVDARLTWELGGPDRGSVTLTTLVVE